MKICIITNCFSKDLIGGSSVYVGNLADELVRKRHEVVIISVHSQKKDAVRKEANLSSYAFSPLNVATSQTIGKSSVVRQALWTILDVYNHYACAKVRNILKKEKPDIVHVHTPIDITLSVFEAIKKLKLPLVFTLHDYLLLCRRVVLVHGGGGICDSGNTNPFCRLYRNFSKRIVENKPDIVIAPSQFISNLFKQNGFFLDSKVVVLPYGIKLNDSVDCHHRVIPKKGSINLLYVGSLTRHKGIDILIKALKGITNSNLRLSIVGTGVYEEKLRHLACADRRITFCGKVQNENINSFYREADVLVVPSIWYEVLGIVIQEAFRAGIPAIGSRIGGIPEIIKDKYNGFLFDAGNSRQLEIILNEIISNPEILIELGRNARETVRSYEMSSHVERLEIIYRDAVKINRC